MADIPLGEHQKLLAQTLQLTAAANELATEISQVRVYGRHNRTYIWALVVSFLLDISLTVALTFVALSVGSSNTRTAQSLATGLCVEKALEDVLKERSAHYDAAIAQLNEVVAANQKDVTDQIASATPAGRLAAQAAYIAALKRIGVEKIPPLPTFNPHC